MIFLPRYSLQIVFEVNADDTDIVECLTDKLKKK